MSLFNEPEVVILGNAGVGKTELQRRLVDLEARFREHHMPTIGADFGMITSNTLRIKLWDTPGELRYKKSQTHLRKPVKAAIVCLDLSKPLDPYLIQDEIEKFRAQQADDGQDIPIILVGTKSDLPRRVSDNEFASLLNDESLKIEAGFKVSAKSKEGIEDVLETMCRYVQKSEDEARDRVEMSCMDKALAQLPDSSDFHTKICSLKQLISKLSSKTQQLIGSDTLEFITKLKTERTVDGQTQAIEDFETKCNEHLGSNHPKITALITGIAVAAVVLVLTALVGFGIGFVAGAWTGPGAFISGFMGSAAAVAVVATSVLAGTGLGLFGGLMNHKTLKNRNEAVEDVVDSATTDSTLKPGV